MATSSNWKLLKNDFRRNFKKFRPKKNKKNQRQLHRRNKNIKKKINSKTWGITKNSKNKIIMKMKPGNKKISKNDIFKKPKIQIIKIIIKIIKSLVGLLRPKNNNKI